MRSRIIVGVVVLTALVGAGTLAARGNSYVGLDKQWTVTNFPDPVLTSRSTLPVTFKVRVNEPVASAANADWAAHKTTVTARMWMIRVLCRMTFS